MAKNPNIPPESGQQNHQQSPEQSERSILSALAIDLTLLRTSRDFRLLFIGQFVALCFSP
ncbi:MAG: hypothetical protein ACRD82_04480 [Blastocatellia bacterium]